MKLKTLSKDSPAQVSLESILIWAAMAGVLASFLPIFAQAMDAQRGLIEKNQVITFSTEAEQSLTALAFYSPGSSRSISIPPIPTLTVEVNEDALIIHWSPASPLTAFSKTIPSFLPLHGSVGEGAHSLRMGRLVDSIHIESE